MSQPLKGSIASVNEVGHHRRRRLSKIRRHLFCKNALHKIEFKTFRNQVLKRANKTYFIEALVYFEYFLYSMMHPLLEGIHLAVLMIKGSEASSHCILDRLRQLQHLCSSIMSTFKIFCRKKKKTWWKVMRMKPKQIKLVTTNSGGKPVRFKKLSFTHFLK